MMDGFFIGNTIYEILGGKHPFIVDYTITQVENYLDRVVLPKKMIGRNEFSEYDVGVTVFTDYNEAEQALQKIEKEIAKREYTNQRRIFNRFITNKNKTGSNTE